MPKRRIFKSGQGGFVVPPQGRPPVGALPGETKEDRDKRVLALAMENPKMRGDELAKALRVPKGVATRIAHQAKLMREEAAKKSAAPAKFLPNQLFTPGPPVAPTPEERIAAVSEEDKAAIAQRYGVVFRR